MASPAQMVPPRSSSSAPMGGGSPALSSKSLSTTSLAAAGATADHYELKPFDLVLFLGNDPVAKFIKNVQLTKVVPSLDRPFVNLWTHAGMVVDSSVLPNLPYLEPGKKYVYESVFSGQVAGYVYSKITPVDHVVKPGGFHLGPQLRPLEDVVNEGDSDVAVCPLNESARAKIAETFKSKPDHFLEVYRKYMTYGYPLTILPQLGAASESLFRKLQNVKTSTDKLVQGTSNFFQSTGSMMQKLIPTKSSSTVATTPTPTAEPVNTSTGSILDNSQSRGLSMEPGTEAEVEFGPGAGKQAKKDPKTVFCSELVADVYKSFGLETYKNRVPAEFTPLECEVSPEFDGRVYHIKENKTMLLKGGRFVPTVTRITFLTHTLTHDVDLSYASWVSMPPDGGSPVNAAVAGFDVNGTPLHIARVRLGDSWHPGCIAQGAKFPTVGYDNKELEVHFGHQVLVSINGLCWVPAKDGEVPDRALRCGVESNMNWLYVARADLEKKAVVGGKIEKAKGVGKVAKHLDGACIGFKGREVMVKEYEVLCRC